MVKYYEFSIGTNKYQVKNKIGNIMLRYLRAFILFSLAVFLSVTDIVASAQDMRNFSIHDLLQLEEISNLQLSPDGQYGVFVYNGPYKEAYKQRAGMTFGTLMIFKLTDNGSAKYEALFPDILGIGRSKFISFSPSGKRIAFRWVSPTGGGEHRLGIYDLGARSLTWLPGQAHWLQDNAGLVWINENKVGYNINAPYDMTQPLPDQYVQEIKRRLFSAWTRKLEGMVPTAKVMYGLEKRGTQDACTDGSFVTHDMQSGSTVQIINHAVQKPMHLGDGQVSGVIVCGDVSLSGRPLTGKTAVMWSRPVLLQTKGDPSLKYICDLCNINFDSLQVSPDKREISFFLYDESGAPLSALLARYSVVTGVFVAKKLENFVPLALDDDVSFRKQSPIIWSGNSIIIYGAMSGVKPTDSFVHNNDRTKTKRRDWHRILDSGKAINLTSELPFDPEQPIAVDHAGLYFWDGGAVLRVSVNGHVSEVWKSLDKRLSLVSPVNMARQDNSNGGPIDNNIILLLEQSLEESAIYSLNIHKGFLEKFETAPGGYNVAAISANRSLMAWRKEKNGQVSYGLTLVMKGYASGFRTLITLNSHLSAINYPIEYLIKYADPEGQVTAACLLVPSGQEKEGPLPTIVNVYPYSGSGDCPSFSSASWTNPLLYTSKGMAYLHIAVRHPVRSPINKEFIDFVDWINPAIDNAIALGYSDPARLVLQGVSQGSFVALNILTNTDRFCSAVVAHGGANFLSFWGELNYNDAIVYGDRYPPFGNIARFQDPTNPLWLGVHPWQEPESYIRISPLFAANRIVTPVLFVSSDLDSFSFSHFQELHTALYHQDKKSSLIYYLGETHGLDSPANILDVRNRVDNWTACLDTLK